MQKHLDGSVALDFPVSAFVSPKPDQLSDFAKIDEKAFLDYRGDAGGCGCKTGCTTSRCRSCYKEGRPCTWRCKCVDCKNPLPFPPPEKLSSSQLQTLPLDQIVAMLTPRDIEYFATRHGKFLHYATMLKLCPKDSRECASCWYCSRFGQRLLPPELQKHFLPVYPTVGSTGEFTPFATRWEETLAGRGQAYVSDTSLVSRVVSSAYAKQAAAAVEAERKAAEAAAAAEEAGEEAVAELDADSAQAEAAAASAATKADEARAAKERAAAAQKAAEVPPDALVASLAKETLLQPGSIRSLFKKHYSQKKKAAQWEAPHQATGAGGDAQAAAVENGSLKYDASLVGRRCTVLWCPEDGDEEDEDYYSATIVAYNSRCAPRKGRFLLHFDCGLRKRVQLPNETVRIMTRRVSSCSCQKSPGGVAGCCEGTDGCEALPRPWEAEPK